MAITKQPPIHCDCVDAMRHAPFHHLLSQFQKGSVGARAYVAMSERDAEPRPFQDAGTSRRFAPTQVRQNIAQQMRARRRQEAPVADDVVTAQTKMMNRARIVESIAFPAVRLA